MEEILKEFGGIGAPSMYEITKLVYEAKHGSDENDLNKITTKSLLSRVEEESVNYATAEHAAIDHLKMASAHLFEETEGRDIDNWLPDIQKMIQKLENRINS